MINIRLAPRTPPSSLVIVLPEDESSSSRTDPLIIRHNGEVLGGHLVFSGWEQVDFQATIGFEGTSTTWIWQDNAAPNSGHGYIATGEHKFLSQDQIIDSSACEPERRQNSYYYRVPFKFRIPELLLSSSTNTLVKLPPSYKGGRAFENSNGQSFMQPLISYTIRAVIVPKDATGRSVDYERSRASRDIIFRPVSLAPPPMGVEDLEGDWQLSSTEALKRRTFGKRLGDLQVSAVEPPPLNIRNDTPRGTTVLPLELGFTPEGECRSRVRPFEWKFRIETKILVWTFYSTLPMDKEPSLQDVKKTRIMDIKSRSMKSETRMIKDPSWGLRQLSQHGTIIPLVSPTWKTCLGVPFNAPKDLMPSFLTPLASRRYALRVSVQVVGMHHHPLELQVPLQVYLEPSKDDDESLEHGEAAADSILSDQGDNADSSPGSGRNSLLTPVAELVRTLPSYHSCTDCTRALRAP